MKLFYFNPNSYGKEFFVCADTKTTAFLDVLDFLNKEAARERYTHYYVDMYSLWCKHSPSNMPEGYTIEEHEPHHVVQTEIC